MRLCNKMYIYNHSPIFIQNILTTIEGKRRAKLRFGKTYHKALKEFNSFDYTDKNKLEKIKNERFLKILHHAYNNSPFYKEFYKDIDISNIKSYKDISMLPILEKDMVRKHCFEMYTIPEKGCHTSKTGGTTGKPILFRHTIQDLQTRLAYLDSFKARHGFFHIKMKRASFNRSNIVPPNQKSKIFWRTNKAMNQRVYSSHLCKRDNIKYYVNDLNRFKPDSIDGYPSSIYSIAKYINENNITLDFTPKAIFTTSETLFPFIRNEIEKAFKCKIFDQYSSSEGATFIFECEHGNLHIGEDTGLIEITDDGEMLITSFFSFGTPLIRYKIGDKAIQTKNGFTCPCGCAFETIDKLIGRTQDYLISKEFGKCESVHLEACIQVLSSKVNAVQFRQDDVNNIHVYLEVENDYNTEEDKALEKELIYKMGKGMNFIFHHVSWIPKEKSGKFKFIINNI